MRMGWKRSACVHSQIMVMVMMLVGAWGCATPTMKPERPQPVSGGVRFTLFAPKAKQVFLVGSFNGWTKGMTAMKIVDGALWSVVVPLREGEYTFMYLIDGVYWLTPPQAEDFVTDGFGQTNGVVVVR
jgi:1,4-alpha-glucan branching enzyme